MTLTDIDLETVRTDELQFKKDKYSGDYSKKSFTIIEGKNPLIISSVHSVKTTEKIMSSRDITKAIEMAKVDEDNVLKRIITGEIITDPKDIEIDPIKINGEKKQISDIADDFKLNPYVLRYYFYKTALEEEKEEEPFTGAYAIYLAKVLDCFAYVRNNNLEANASVDHQNSEFIRLLKETGIKLHLDLHGAKYFEDKSKNNFDVAYGTNRGQYIYDYETFKKIATSSYALYNMTNIQFETKFQAGTNRTLCNQVYRYSGINTEYGIQTFQAEVSGEYRRPKSYEENSRRVLAGTIDFLGNFMDEEKGRIYGRRFKS